MKRPGTGPDNHKINAMLLNEVQKQHREITDLKVRLEALERLLVSEKK